MLSDVLLGRCIGIFVVSPALTLRSHSSAFFRHPSTRLLIRNQRSPHSRFRHALVSRSSSSVCSARSRHCRATSKYTRQASGSVATLAARSNCTAFFLHALARWFILRRGRPATVVGRSIDPFGQRKSAIIRWTAPNLRGAAINDHQI